MHLRPAKGTQLFSKNSFKMFSQKMLVCPLCLKNRRRLATECKVNFDINETVNFDVI